MKRLVSILALATIAVGCLPTPADAAFGVDDFDVAFTDESGGLAMHAGSHPFALTTSLDMNVSGGEPEGRLRGFLVDEIPGLVADTTAYPRCSAENFEALQGKFNDCPDVTVVGVAESAFGEPGNHFLSPIFNLPPPPGVLMRFGFRVADAANVVADVELSPEPPYTAVVSMEDIPEAIELFGLQLQLWGVPADRAHDSQRGACVGGSGSCPVAIPERPLITSPTSCEGPQETLYEAFSWAGDEDGGLVPTHDGAGDPVGFSGCGSLDFEPTATVTPTTEGAGGPAGLELSVGFLDQGLVSTGHVAQSQVRGLEVELPEGMSPGPSLGLAAGSCSEADLEAETASSAVGAGCPGSSIVGSVEVESPLVDEPIGGVAYRAAPDDNFAGDAPAALYVVLKNADLGVVVAQPVAVEVDPETGRWIAIAEEMPQLPFSDLRLRLDDGQGGPMISPPRCGKYEMATDFEPWSTDDVYRLLSSFQIRSAPHGGPCPTDDGGGVQTDRASGSTSAPGPTPPASGADANSPRRAPKKHRCHGRRHRAHHYGGAHCAGKSHGKHRAHRRRHGRSN